MIVKILLYLMWSLIDVLVHKKEQNPKYGYVIIGKLQPIVAFNRQSFLPTKFCNVSFVATKDVQHMINHRLAGGKGTIPKVPSISVAYWLQKAIPANLKPRVLQVVYRKGMSLRIHTVCIYEEFNKFNIVDIQGVRGPFQSLDSVVNYTPLSRGDRMPKILGYRLLELA